MTQVGNMKLLHIDIKKPLEMNQTFDGNYMLTLFTGMNGAGKSFIMKIVWAMLYIANSFVSAGRKGELEIAQFVFDHTIPGHDMIGTIRMHYESGVVAIFGFSDGKCISGRVDYTDKIDTLSMPVFMSSYMRLFSSMKYYLVIRRQCGFKNEKLIEEMVKHFALYDICYVEKLISKMPIIVTKDLQEKFNMFSMPVLTDVQTIEFDELSDDFFLTNNNSTGRRWLSQLSAGEQSILNMTIGAAT